MSKQYRLGGDPVLVESLQQLAEPGWIVTYARGDTHQESLNGVMWADAPLPGRLHACTAQTRGYPSVLSYVERCACGAIRLGPHRPWMEKNQRRKTRRKP